MVNIRYITKHTTTYPVAWNITNRDLLPNSSSKFFSVILNTSVKLFTLAIVVIARDVMRAIKKMIIFVKSILSGDKLGL